MKRAALKKVRPFVSALQRLPDLHPVIGCQIKFLTRLYVERVIPSIDIAHGLCAEVGGCVPVGGEALPQGGIADLRAPRLAEGEEETLIASKAVDYWRRLAIQRFVIGGVGYGEAGDVGDVFSERLLAVDV